MTFSVAFFAPTVVGLNVTLIVQLAPEASEAPQVVAFENCPGLAPVIVGLERASVAAPVFFTVTDCARLAVPCVTLPKPSECGETVNGAVAPVPVRATACVPPLLVFTSRIAFLTPVDVGLNLTLTVQLPPTATVAPQVVVFENWPGLVPAILILVIGSAAAPAFDTVTTCAAL